MTLPASGAISKSQVNTELGRSSTATISLGESDVRTLAGVPSGAISMSNLHGKSADFSSFTLTAATYDDYHFHLSTATAQTRLLLGTNGELSIVKLQGGTSYPTNNWARPLITGKGSGYEMKWDLVSGSNPSAVLSAGTWYGLGTIRELAAYAQRTTNGITTVTSTFTLTIRIASGSQVASANITLSAVAERSNL